MSGGTARSPRGLGVRDDMMHVPSISDPANRLFSIALIESSEAGSPRRQRSRATGRPARGKKKSTALANTLSPFRVLPTKQTTQRTHKLSSTSSTSVPAHFSSSSLSLPHPNPQIPLPERVQIRPVPKVSTRRRLLRRRGWNEYVARLEARRGEDVPRRWRRRRRGGSRLLWARRL